MLVRKTERNRRQIYKSLICFSAFAIFVSATRPHSQHGALYYVVQLVLLMHIIVSATKQTLAETIRQLLDPLYLYGIGLNVTPFEVPSTPSNVSYT